MYETVFLNADRLDYDHGLDFSELSEIVPLIRYGDSSADEIPARVEGQTIVITKELALEEELIKRLPATVRLICEAGTGYNNIDIEAAATRGIAVCNVPSYSTDAVAQLAITFILNLSASLGQQQNMLARGNQDNFRVCLQTPHVELNGKVLGLLGFGEISRKVISIARTLGMKFLVYTRTPRPELEPDVSFVSLEELLINSDFVSIHCPLTAATRYLLDCERLALMKPSAYLINTSRGAIVRETDLIEALRQGTIAGAGLDVQEAEPLSPDNPLLFMDNVIITPPYRLETSRNPAATDQSYCR